ncbi:Fur family transcriptional regulator [Papillibacter cinnamivorans]|uniref:Fur family transcriptional regulator, peroxide stress response regulator n=1 Tax=Papillibacter cinnamivorans DSM 12816 TaxID=1122930 RepID=A0A1W2BX40_9FIRM|nr:transcriptional repressor [Papillibacter cinnamivorans]SMC77451.1 Fur family transcriptional regulator, peroxide stress response regulator [Papillibacter cinnamivorans DSM 12816]
MKLRRYSRQREIIHAALKETKEHPTADMLYERLKPENPNLSLGTVYRNLNQLVEEGSVRRLSFPVERFDARTEAHPHMICIRCGRVVDIDLPYCEALDRQATDMSGHEVSHHELLFSGTCEDCRKIINIKS